MIELNMKNIQGLYKIRESVFNRILQPSLKVDNKYLPGISDNELMLYIQLTHIASSEGIIEFCRIKDLAADLSFSLKGLYNALNGLVQKRFVDVENNDLCYGIKKINLIDEDFSKVTDYKQKRNHYLGTNYWFLHPKSPDYKQFKELSLNSKKLLLYVAKSYDDRYGYRADIESIRKLLGVSRKSKVISYIRNILPLCGGKNNVSVFPNGTNRIKYSLFWVKKENFYLRPEQEIADFCDTYYKHSINFFIKENGYLIRPLYAESNAVFINEFITDLFAKTKSLIDKGNNITQIIKCITDSITAELSIDELTAFRINKNLNTSFG